MNRWKAKTAKDRARQRTAVRKHSKANVEKNKAMAKIQGESMAYYLKRFKEKE